jgi:anti-anti-sigma regulatory factor
MRDRVQLFEGRSYKDRQDSEAIHLEIAGEAVLPETISLKKLFIESLTVSSRVILHIDRVATLDTSFLQLLAALVRSARERNKTLVLSSPGLPKVLMNAFRQSGTAALLEDLLQRSEICPHREEGNA